MRDDNPSAIKIYADLGFVELARRTTYQAKPDPLLTRTENGVAVSERHPRFWAQQREWLAHSYPDQLTWYTHWNSDVLAPSWWNWIYLAFIDMDLRQWAAIKDGELLATLAWMPVAGRATDVLWAAVRPDGDAAGLRSVLEAARRELSQRRGLVLDYPAGEAEQAIQSAGFTPVRTLIWMQASGPKK